jgi:hypothetical protein
VSIDLQKLDFDRSLTRSFASEEIQADKLPVSIFELKVQEFLPDQSRTAGAAAERKQT